MLWYWRKAFVQKYFNIFQLWLSRTLLLYPISKMLLFLVERERERQRKREREREREESDIKRFREKVRRRHHHSERSQVSILGDEMVVMLLIWRSLLYFTHIRTLFWANDDVGASDEYVHNTAIDRRVVCTVHRNRSSHILNIWLSSAAGDHAGGYLRRQRRLRVDQRGHGHSPFGRFWLSGEEDLWIGFSGVHLGVGYVWRDRCQRLWS